MRTVLTVLLAAALAAGAWFVYTRFFAPGPRACAAVADRCGLAGEQARSCERLLDEVRQADADAAERLTRCLADAESCAEAAGCATGAGSAVFSRAFIEFLDGLRKSR
jgi:hypothetical protein